MALRSLEETKPFVVVDSIVFINYATISNSMIENAKHADLVTAEQRSFLKGLTFGPINR
ncbi:hypothetical protein [Pseudomonas sp. NFX183]|uniref:phage tail tip fiber protein n=1 Tax=Pseudomonas sp. NFX183 TaxID=3399573 RepID=UPI003A5C145A